MARIPLRFLSATRPGLDFLNSIATPVDTPIDWIDDGEGLLSWLEQAQLLPADALDEHSRAGASRRTRQGGGSGEELARVVQGLCAPAQGPPSDGGGSSRSWSR